MKSTLRLILAALVVLAGSTSAFAQSYTLDQTTLNGAINATHTTLVLTSASASSGSSFGAPAAGQCLMAGNELMRIVSMSSTTATVLRARGGSSALAGVGGGGTVAVAHPTLTVIWIGACSASKNADPPADIIAAAGQQGCSTQPRPWINVTNGNVWFCNTVTNSWRGTNALTFTYGSQPIGQ